MQILPSHASNHDSPESKSIPFYRNIQGKHEDLDLTVRVHGLIRVLVFLLADETMQYRIMFVPYVKFHGLMQNNTRTIFFFHPSHFFKSYEYFLCILLSSLFLLFASIDWLLFVKQPYEHANQHPACLLKLAPMARLIFILAVSAM